VAEIHLLSTSSFDFISLVELSTLVGSSPTSVESDRNRYYYKVLNL
jgi:hypothetical protein